MVNEVSQLPSELDDMYLHLRLFSNCIPVALVAIWARLGNWFFVAKVTSTYGLRGSNQVATGSRRFKDFFGTPIGALIALVLVVQTTVGQAQQIQNAAGYWGAGGQMGTSGLNGNTTEKFCNVPLTFSTTITDIATTQSLALSEVTACVAELNAAAQQFAANCTGPVIVNQAASFGGWESVYGTEPPTYINENRAEALVICSTTYASEPGAFGGGVVADAAAWICYFPQQYPILTGDGGCGGAPDSAYFLIATPPTSAQTTSPDPVAEPVNPALGNVYTSETDISVAGQGRIGFLRYYNSADSAGADNVPGWRHSYDRYIQPIFAPAPLQYPGQSASVSPLYATAQAACEQGFVAIRGSVTGWANGSVTYNNGICVFTASSGATYTLVIQSNAKFDTQPTTPVEYDVIRDDGQTLRFPVMNGTVSNLPSVSIRLAITGSGFTVTDDEDNVETYNSAGVLQSITSRAGVVQSLTYTNGVWSGVTDSFGNTLSVTRNIFGSIVGVVLNGGGNVQYSYGNSNQLSTVTNLDGTTRSYVYQSPYASASFNNELIWVVDENGTTLSTWGYDSQERATSSTLAVGANATALTYNADGSVTTTDALGAERTFTYTRLGDINRVTAISGSKCPTCLDSATTSYDSYGWVASRTDYNGNLTCYVNDPTRGLELVRVEGLPTGGGCPSNLASYTPTGAQRKVSTTWSPAWREPATITKATSTTSFTYDESGNALTKTITDTSVNPNVSRTWTFTYNGLGQVLSAKGPRTDVHSITSYQYYNCTSGAQCGHLQTLTNALGQVRTFNSYNVYGQPVTLTDPNGTVTTFTYDARQRVTSWQVGTDTTSYSYYPTGLLNTTTLPDGSTLSMTYDSAHRLTQIADGAGNYVTYTLDALGNRTAESAYDTTGTLSRTHSRVFNALSELYEEIGSNSASTTTVGYDANGNVVSVDAPLARNTATQYDALNRRAQITDPANGVTTIAYDASNNVAGITDPNALTTSYTHDGFNELTQQVSPGTGTTTYAYDSGGNLQTQADARGATTASTYDALNRVTSTAFTLGGVTDQTLNYTYDTGPNGQGRLTEASDAAHLLVWSYDASGRVTGMGQTVGGITESIGYGYTNGDVTTVTTPSGQTISYTYADHQITSVSINSTALLTNAAYEPFGPVRGWNWSNGTTEVRLYDTDGNPSQLSSVEGSSLSYDAAYRITGITNTSNTALSWTLGYDSLDRTTGASESGTSFGYGYDADGNRLTQAGPATTNPLWNAGASFTYNARGRMSSASQGPMTTTYTYNALGQMIEKSGATTTMLVYDLRGHLVGEYTGAGALIQETVWLNDLPVATLRPASGGIAIYYVHADQLGAPRLITRPADNVIMWRWDTDPFGTAAPNQNPQAQGAFVYNLRFPGQYYQTETGLNYNYFRDYDPNSGQYVQSDPIGLASGVNTYAYARGNPVFLTDPLGLCPPNDGCPPSLFTPNDELVSEAAIAALSLINPNQNEANNIGPLNDNFAKVNNPAAINTTHFGPSFTTHGTSIESAVPGYSSYAVKMYSDPSLGNTIAVTNPTNSIAHILNWLPWFMGQPVNAQTADDFLMAIAANSSCPW